MRRGWGAPHFAAAYGLARREWRRFFKDWIELIGGPAATTALYMGALLLAAETDPMPMGAPLASFVAPGLIALAVGYNAFLHPGFVIVYLKLEGGIGDELSAPLSPLEIVFGHAAPAAAAGLVTGAAAALLLSPLAPIRVADPLVTVAYLAGAGAMMAGLGTAVGVLSRGWDQFSAISGLIVLPLGFFSAVFFPLSELPPLVAGAMLYMPLHLAVDGTRSAMIGVSAVDPAIGLPALWAWVAVAWGFAWATVRRAKPLRD
ncbi:MAG: ABC transporter permease [Pseudomonadota bacterium]